MNEPMTLKQLFADRFFRVPDYQRGYAWGERQLNELWQDLQDVVSNEDGSLRPHYTGTIYVEKMPFGAIPEEDRWAKTASTNFFYVVDGQQRLTTISILMNELIRAEGVEYSGERIDNVRELFVKKLNAVTKLGVNRFGYAAEKGEDPTDLFFKSEILQLSEDVPAQHPDTVYTRNLLFAKTYFADRIAGMDKDDRETLYRKLTESLRFNLHEIGSDIDVQAVFETMNNRGKPLTVLEKLKNRLMYLTEHLQETPEKRAILRRSINQAWKYIYAKLGEGLEQELNEDEFLTAHLSAYRNPGTAVFSMEMAEKRLFEMFSTHAEDYMFEVDSNRCDEIVSYEKIDSYIRDLSDFAAYWREVLETKDETIQKILYLDGGRYMKVTLAVLLKCEPDAVNGSFKDLEKIVFRNSVVGVHSMSGDVLMSHIRKLYRGECDSAEFRECLIGELMPASAEAVASGFAYLFTYSRQVGFFKWNKNALHYLLFEYENVLKKKYGKNFDRIPFYKAKEYSIEHILPQTWETYWRGEVEAFCADANAASRCPNPHKVLINTVGNLLLMDSSTNSGIGNYPWEVKHKRIASGLSYGEFDVGKQTTWGKKEIEERGRGIFEFLGELIGCKFTEDQIRKALFATPEIYAESFGENK